MKRSINKSVIIGAVALILVVVAGFFIFRANTTKQFAEPDKKLTNGTMELCSDYADLCFTRPADWTRSSILHAGLAKQDNIEINPPTGTILRFEAISDDTDTVCPSGDKCTITTIGITDLGNDLNVVSGVFNVSPLNSNAISSHTSFIQLVSSQDIRSYNLQTGKSVAYTTFNPGVSFGNAPKVMIQVSPGKGFDSEKALQWVSSSEGNMAKQILASTRSR